MVREHNANKQEAWEVIDGQQRLTTIRLILGYFEEPCYKLCYATRANSADFIQQLLEGVDVSDLADKNIDYFYMQQAYVCIKSFFGKKGEPERERFLKTLLESVEFIWYKPDDGSDARDVFSRLNDGKIPLTDAELIKAKMLRSSAWNARELPRRQEIALQWDEVENALQADDFWYFLSHEDSPTPTRIDLIFKLMCGMPLWGGRTDTHEVFREVTEVYSLTNEESIGNFWRKVMERYQMFCEWYRDADLFHYVGFLLSKDGDSRRCSLKTLCDWWEGTSVPDRTAFLQKVKQQVWERLALGNISDKEAIRNALIEGKYYDFEGCDKKTACRPILLLHNVQSIVMRIGQEKCHYGLNLADFYRFPFHFYNKESWDVEHIDSHTENDCTSPAELKAWMRNVHPLIEPEEKKRRELDSSNTCSLSERVRDWVNDKSSVDMDKGKSLKGEVEELLGWEAAPSPEAAPGMMRHNFRLYDIEKNQLWNFALLNASINRSYGNAIFPVKRRLLIEREREHRLPEFLSDEDCTAALARRERDTASSSFIPPCTMEAFEKKNSASNPYPNWWTREDAEAYLNDISTKLADFRTGMTDTH